MSTSATAADTWVAEGLPTALMSTNPPKAILAGVGRVRRVPTAKGGFFRWAEEVEVVEVTFSLR